MQRIQHLQASDPGGTYYFRPYNKGSKTSLFLFIQNAHERRMFQRYVSGVSSIQYADVTLMDGVCVDVGMGRRG